MHTELTVAVGAATEWVSGSLVDPPRLRVKVILLILCHALLFRLCGVWREGEADTTFGLKGENVQITLKETQRL